MKPQSRTHGRAPVTPETIKGRLMLRVREYAELTGTPEASVYRYISTGTIPSIRIGATVRIPVSALLEQINQ